MGVIRDAAAQPVEVDLRPLTIGASADTGFDPSLLHYWSQVEPSGEWPVVTVSPACSSWVKRRVPSDVVDSSPDPSLFDVCPVCREVAEVLEVRG